MMKIKKIGLVLLSVAALALIFTACAADPEDTDSTTTTTYRQEDGTGYGQTNAPGQGQGQYGNRAAGSGNGIIQSSPLAESDTSDTVQAVSDGGGYGSSGALTSSDPSIEDMLNYAIQDEYLAHAEYQYILNTFGSQRPFSNIIKAEETHIAELTPLFAQYGYTLPANDAAAYLVAPADVREALETGVQAEINNIAMYELFLRKDLPDDIRIVFEELRDGSINHLNAFRTALNNRY